MGDGQAPGWHRPVEKGVAHSVIALMCSEQYPIDHQRLNHLGHDVRHILAGRRDVKPYTGLPEGLMWRGIDEPERTVDLQASRTSKLMRTCVTGGTVSPLRQATAMLDMPMNQATGLP